MPDYRRNHVPGAAYFFTVITQNRVPIFSDARARDILHQSFLDVRNRFPFEMWASVLLPNHLHCIWILPHDDDAYSRRWSIIKRTFSKQWSAIGGTSSKPSESRRRHRELNVWQRRFWEHTIRNDEELFAYRDYIHMNPVKHGLVTDPHAWRWSSVHRHLRLGWLEPDWTGVTRIRIDVPDDE